MCILALYFQQFENYPLIVAANRDEFFTRPSTSPRVLATDPLIFGGKDLLAGGTWLGVNEHGLLAGILNRKSDTKKDQATVRSRGLLCLDILKVRDPLEACALLRKQKGSVYQPFNLIFANGEQAYVAYDLDGAITWVQLEKGLHVFSNTSVDNARSEKKDHAYLLFSRAEEWLHLDKNNPLSCIPDLKIVLSDHALAEVSSDPKESICVHTQSYGTVSSSIIFYIPGEKRFRSYHTTGPPCSENYGESMSVEVL